MDKSSRRVEVFPSTMACKTAQNYITFPPVWSLFPRSVCSGELPKYETEKFHGCKFGQRTALRDTNWAGNGEGY